MANENNFKATWNIEVDMEINHESGYAGSKIFKDGKLLMEMKFMQGFYLDQNRKIMEPDAVEAFKWLISLLRQNS